MDKFEIADALYERAFPAVVVLCAVGGTVAYGYGEYLQAISAFVSIGLGVKLNGVVEQRRYERSERLAGQGWTRARMPMNNY